MIDKIVKDIDDIDIGLHIDISLSKMLKSIYHINNVDTVKSIKSSKKQNIK